MNTLYCPNMRRYSNKKAWKMEDYEAERNVYLVFNCAKSHNHWKYTINYFSSPNRLISEVWNNELSYWLFSVWKGVKTVPFTQQITMRRSTVYKPCKHTTFNMPSKINTSSRLQRKHDYCEIDPDRYWYCVSAWHALVFVCFSNECRKHNPHLLSFSFNSLLDWLATFTLLIKN